MRKFFTKQRGKERKKQKKNLLPRHHELYIGRQKQNTRFNKYKYKYMMLTNLSSFRIDNLCLLYSVMRFDNNDLNAYKNQIFIS